ncbi:BMP family lipoprotein [Silvanigrella aquatica]|uniref:ABC transporter substrate-binding protein PnrA-like domain-containing protein n=1 Tax=Silvanigrella aquatica TaxID=1915309 RepID=A0A1L4D4I5_9BACT|nr:BMP family ABC transporter substrate-binding protein [Silvanigrella aquatica]APJ05108.1 hypothetical protein AXG55_06275 [Silvanigrella aquatica]
MKLKIISITSLLLYFPAYSAERICMVLDRGGKEDKSFNQSAVEGFQQAKESLKISDDSKFLETRSDEQIQHFLRTFSVDKTCNLIISVGFNPSSYVKALAEKYPDKKYLAIDNQVISSKNNVRSALFREDEGAFLIGSIAAMKSKSKKIGMIGGMDIPMMKRFALAFEAGAKHVSPKIEVRQSIIGTTPEAWNNPSKAKEIALSQYNNGVDIIFQVAGPSGLGVFDAATQLNKINVKEKKHFAIGVDSNQNGMAPGIVLTSMVKHVDIAVYMAIKDLVEKKFTAEIKQYDLRNGGIDWAFDKYNRSLISGFEMRKINKIRSEIIDGKIKVPDYYEITKKSGKKT